MPNPELSPHTNNLNMPNPELSPHTNNLNIPNPELSPHTKQRHWQRVNRKIPNTPEPAPSTEVSFEHEAVCENTPILRNNEALEDKTTAKPFLLQQESNLPAGRYVVEVLSEGKSIETLRTMLVMNRLVTVGRYSSTHERPLDIDLSGHFGVRGEESLCSRRQAEIYWSQGMIVIRNLGANPLRRYIPGGGRQTIGILHIWQPGELVEVPGGLFLRLLREEET
jgi:hypothetical protein